MDPVPVKLTHHDALPHEHEGCCRVTLEAIVTGGGEKAIEMIEHRLPNGDFPECIH